MLWRSMRRKLVDLRILGKERWMFVSVYEPENEGIEERSRF